MSKNIIFILAVFICVSSFGQTKNDSIFSNKKFVPIKNLNRDLLNKNSEILILESKDTLVLTTIYPQKFIYPNLATKEETRKFKTYYPYIAFGSFNSKYTKTTTNNTLRQWNVPIKVFIDKSFQKETRKEIEKFIMDISNLNIQNLKIALVKNIRNSNYYITTTSEQLEVLDEKKLDRYSDAQIKNRFKNNANYYLISDDIKSYSCVLKVNPNTFIDSDNISVKVKTLFFGSLGRFYPISHLKESLLYTKYENNDTISTFDKNILKTHYNYIYPYKVDFDLFKQLENE
ncbi:MAG: DUF2927 domain-containing protein [Urechidicola sp.]|nr:DUF2927 domain-containing protein [Urechidicola sp.]